MKTYQTIIVVFCALFVINCSSIQQPKSPIEVLKTLNEASKTRDVAAIKNSVSKGTINLMEESAKKQNTTVEELLKKDNGAPFKELPEVRNEKINGETATVELKNTATGGWEEVPFVKEDGNWKLALDVYMDNLKKLSESLKSSSAPENNADGSENSNSNSSISSSASGDSKKKSDEAANKAAKPKK